MPQSSIKNLQHHILHRYLSLRMLYPPSWMTYPIIDWRIFKFQLHISNLPPRKPSSFTFHPVILLLTFYILHHGCHIWFVILDLNISEFSIQIRDQYTQKPPNTIIRMKQNVYQKLVRHIGFTIWNFFNFWPQIHDNPRRTISAICHKCFISISLNQGSF